MARITAERLVEHLERSGYVVMHKPPLGQHGAPGTWLVGLRRPRRRTGVSSPSPTILPPTPTEPTAPTATRLRRIVISCACAQPTPAGNDGRALRCCPASRRSPATDQRKPRLGETELGYIPDATGVGLRPAPTPPLCQIGDIRCKGGAARLGFLQDARWAGHLDHAGQQAENFRCREGT
jgi:hypothetical protein